MSRPAIVWAQVENYFSRRGYTIKFRGGERIIVAPKKSDARRTRNQIVIGHKCCDSPRALVYDCYLNNIKNAFGVTRNDILND